MEKHSAVRDSWGSKWGFILACIGSAVGMGNIWLFPARVSQYGGATFLIPYLIFVVIIGSTGVIGEMAFGRATRSGPIGAFGYATKLRFGHERPGRLLGLIPVLGSLALAIGYSVVTGWIFKYTADALTGTLSRMSGLDAFAAHFNATAAGNVPWQLVGMAVTIAILAFGIGRGIELANKVMTPLFYVLFVGLAVYLFTLPASGAGYQYIFVLDPKGLLDPVVWIYALGQAFFSLSVAGNGTLIYGSYLSRSSNVPSDARMVAVFDTVAALLAALPDHEKGAQAILIEAECPEKAEDEAMAVRRLGFYARCGAKDTGWTEHLFDAWFRVLVLPCCGGKVRSPEEAVRQLADCYRRTMGEPQWRRNVTFYRPDGVEVQF